MRSAAERPMSAAKQFKAAVTSEAFPSQGWRGGLERSHARGGVFALSRSRCRCTERITKSVGAASSLLYDTVHSEVGWSKAALETARRLRSGRGRTIDKSGNSVVVSVCEV